MKSKLIMANLTINNGEWAWVETKIEDRGNKFHGYVRGDDRLIKIAAEDGSAMLVLGPDLHLARSC